MKVVQRMLEYIKKLRQILETFKSNNQGGALANTIILSTVLSILMLSVYNINAQNIAEVRVNKYMLSLAPILSTIEQKAVECLNEMLHQELSEKVYTIIDETVDINSLIQEDIRSIIQTKFGSTTPTFSCDWVLGEEKISLSGSLETRSTQVGNKNYDDAFIYLWQRLSGTVTITSTTIFGLTQTLDYEEINFIEEQDIVSEFPKEIQIVTVPNIILLSSY